MNITPSRIRKILTRRLSRHTGTRASGLAGYRLGVLGVGTALVCKFLYLDLGLRNWFGFCVGILVFPHFYVLGWFPSFPYLWR